jgi:hypothetical protein
MVRAKGKTTAASSPTDDQNLNGLDELQATNREARELGGRFP